MPRHVLTLNDLGEEGSWLLVQQARGIPDAKGRTDFMTERTAVLLFAQDSFAERLCVSAAVRQMGGSIVFQGATGGWKSEVERYQRQMLAVIDYFVDCMYVYGIPGLATKVDRIWCSSPSSMRAARTPIRPMCWPTWPACCAIPVTI